MSDFLAIDKLDDSIEGGVIASILVKEGDVIQKGDVLLEMETDKALIDIRSHVSGKVKKLLVKKGENAKIGQRYLEFEPAEDEASSIKQEQANGQKPADENETKAVEESKNVKESFSKVTVADQELTNVKESANKQDVSQPAQKVVKVPVLGDSIDEVLLAKLLVKKGDAVSKDQPVAELESDKAGFELKSDYAGTVLEIYPKPNQNIKVGDDFFKLALTNSSVTDEQQANRSDEVTETSSQKDAKADLESQPTTKTSPTTQLKEVEQTSKEDVKTNPKAIASPDEADIFEKLSSVNAPPNVRRFAREIGVDIYKVKGSASKGRILVKDVKEYARMLNDQSAADFNITSRVALKLPDFAVFGEIKKTPLSGIKKATAKNMAKIWQTVPMVTHFDEANVSDLEKFRQQNKADFIEQKAKLTMTAIMIKVMELVLKKFPNFNSSFDEASDELIVKNYINIGIAVDTPNGLLVPVIKDVPNKSIFDISKELDSLSKKARDRKISPTDLSGASFTISNLGGIAGSGFTPIVNWPEVAILGLAKSSIKPLYDGQSFNPALMMPLALSYDHRVIDGAEAARFVKYLVNLLQKPFQLALFVD